MFDGQGILTHQNGQMYSGEFREGKYNGKGTLLKIGGTTEFVGEFKDG